MPQVHLDASVLVTYYAILVRGCAIPDENATVLQHRERHLNSVRLYGLAIRALPAWQREATGTMHDFIAAVIMVSQIAYVNP